MVEPRNPNRHPPRPHLSSATRPHGAISADHQCTLIHEEPVNGIVSPRQLIEYLRPLQEGRVGADDDLLIALEGLRTQRLLGPLFDETLPVPNLASTQCVIWNFGGLELPTADEEYTAHLHDKAAPGKHAAQALYGLGVELAQSIFFSRPDRPDI